MPLADPDKETGLIGNCAANDGGEGGIRMMTIFGIIRDLYEERGKCISQVCVYGSVAAAFVLLEGSSHRAIGRCQEGHRVVEIDFFADLLWQNDDSIYRSTVHRLESSASFNISTFDIISFSFECCKTISR